MKKILIAMTLLSVSLMGLSQVNRAPKKIYLPPISVEDQDSYKMAQLGTGETVSLDNDVDYLQATYYTSGGKHYYNFMLQNYDTELPSLTLLVEAPSKTRINGNHAVMLKFSSLDIEIEGKIETLTLSSATLNFTSTGGFCEYDVEIMVVASDGNTYTFNSAIVIDAFDADDDYSEIILEDGEVTSVNQNVSFIQQPTKFIENGRVLINCNGRIYDLNGVEVK